MPRGVEAEMLLAGYYVALQDERIETLEAVVMHLVKGTWREEVKFCPRPPELANMVREEQRRVDAINRPRLPAPAAVKHQYKDVRISHRQRVEELSNDGYTLIAEGVTHDAFGSLAKSRAIPAGSIHLWAIDEVWCPGNVSHMADTGRIASRKQDRVSSEPEMTDERIAMLERIASLPDAKTITAEQQAYRRRVSAEIEKAKGEYDG